MKIFMYFLVLLFVVTRVSFAFDNVLENKEQWLAMLKQESIKPEVIKIADDLWVKSFNSNKVLNMNQEINSTCEEIDAVIKDKNFNKSKYQLLNNKLFNLELDKNKLYSRYLSMLFARVEKSDRETINLLFVNK
jgi:hypothetical protein